MTESPSNDWMTYDSVADVYVQVAVPWFAPIAHDLIAAVHPEPGERVLDLGTGTGLVAGLVQQVVAPSGVVLGVDPSVAMLTSVGRHTRIVLVAGRAPGLPIVSHSLDLVVANLVLSHLPDLRDGLADVVRVIRRDGRLGCTAWATPLPPGPGNDRPEANDIVASIKDALEMNLPQPERGPVPHEDWLYGAGHLREVLVQSGLTDMRVNRHRYDVTTTIADFLSGWGAQGRYLRYRVGQRRWDEFVRRASAALTRRFGSTIRYQDVVWVAVAWKR